MTIKGVLNAIGRNRAARRAVFSAGLALLASTPVLAQVDDPGIPKVQAVDNPAGAPNPVLEPALVMLAEGDPGERSAALRERVRRGAESLIQDREGNKNKFPLERVVVEEISKSDYETYRRLFIQGLRPSAGIGSGGVDNPSLRPGVRPTEKVWELDLGGAYALRKLSVDLRERLGPKTETVEIDPAAPAGAGKYKFSVERIASGNYLIRHELPDSLIPVAYKVVRARGTQTSEHAGKWLSGDSYWVITIKGFSAAERAPLINKLRDPSVTGNMIYGTMAAPPQDYVMVDARAVPSTGGLSVTESTVTFRINSIAERMAKRVYMLFPLKEEQARKLAADLIENQTEFTITEYIQNNRPVAASTSTPLKPGMEAAWFEIPASRDGIGFQRAFPIENVKGWRSLPAADQKVWRLVVWQFEREDGSNPAALKVPDRADPNRQVIVLVEEVGEWPTGIRSIPDPLR